MNYSEMVGRYTAKIEWSKKPMGGETTASMIEYGKIIQSGLLNIRIPAIYLNEEIFSYGEDIRE